MALGAARAGGYNRTTCPRAPATTARRNGRRTPAIPPEQPEGARIDLVLDAAAGGLRLDKALADALPDHSRTEITAWIREGRVLVEGAALAAKHKVHGGEAVVVLVPPPKPTHPIPQDIPLEIVFEDDAIAVVNKPSGLTVHPGAGQPDGTLANALAGRWKDLPELGGSDRPGIVHRLDKETSGILVVARTESAQRKLSTAFAERTVAKTYLACVHGNPRDESGHIDAPIGRMPNHRTKMAIREGGREAQTTWHVAERMPRHALIRCHPRTGRTHQIRVHLKHLGHPILGDGLYGLAGHPGEEHTQRLMLHAHRLEFPHPVTNERVAFEAAPPQEFEATLAALRELEPPRRAR